MPTPVFGWNGGLKADPSPVSCPWDDFAASDSLISRAGVEPISEAELAPPSAHTLSTCGADLSQHPGLSTGEQPLYSHTPPKEELGAVKSKSIYLTSKENHSFCHAEKEMRKNMERKAECVFLPKFLLENTRSKE